MNNNILFRALTNKLTSDLPRFIDSSKTVLDWAAPIELPPSTGMSFLTLVFWLLVADR